MKRCAMLIAALSALSITWAQEASSLGAGGSLSSEPFASWAEARQGGSTAGWSYGSSTTLGLELRARGEKARAEASFEAAVLTGTAAGEAWAVAGSSLARRDELLLPMYTASAAAPETLVAARVRSLYVKYDAPWASVLAGRQVINYGRGVLWNPADIFTELDLSGLSPVRRGSDALRLLVPLGQTEGLDLVAVPASAPADGRYALRGSGVIGSLDGAAIAAHDGAKKAWLLGADFKTDLELGVVGDAVYEIPDAGGGELRAVAGLDYSFGFLVVALEYYYNGGGALADPFFPGRHNGYASLSLGATELASISAVAIVDLEAGTGSLLLLASLNLAQNADLELFLKGSRVTGCDGYAASSGMGIVVKF